MAAKAKEFWDSQEVIADVSKNDKGDVIRISKVTKGSGKFVDVRTYYKDALGNLAPGKGIAIPDDLVDEIALLMMDGGTTDEDDNQCRLYPSRDQINHT